METAVDYFINSIIYKLEMTLKDIEENNPALYDLYLECKKMEEIQQIEFFKAGNECSCMEHENIEDYFNKYKTAQ
jgi:hypothetical protein